MDYQVTFISSFSVALKIIVRDSILYALNTHQLSIKQKWGVITPCINEDQSGYLKCRYIGQNIRLLQDNSFFTDLKQIPCTVLLFDFEKEFDSLRWNILFKT